MYKLWSGWGVGKLYNVCATTQFSVILHKDKRIHMNAALTCKRGGGRYFNILSVGICCFCTLSHRLKINKKDVCFYLNINLYYLATVEFLQIDKKYKNTHMGYFSFMFV